MLTVKTILNTSLEKAWNCWNLPQHITNWCFASPDWHAPYAENELKVGGKFKTTMAAKDGSFSFDFEGEYTEVLSHQKIAYVMPDGRKVEILFTSLPEGIEISESFDPENENPLEMQQAGWQAILESFRRYVEGQL